MEKMDKTAEQIKNDCMEALKKFHAESAEKIADLTKAELSKINPEYQLDVLSTHLLVSLVAIVASIDNEEMKDSLVRHIKDKFDQFLPAAYGKEMGSCLK